MPIQENGQLNFIEEIKGKRTKFTENIQIQFVQGHTKSMMLPMIQYHGKTIVYMADLIPSAAHIPIPYVMGYDMFPMTTLEEKETFLAEAVEKDFILFFEHDHKIECCTVQKTERGYKKKDVLKLNDI